MSTYQHSKFVIYMDISKLMNKIKRKARLWCGNSPFLNKWSLIKINNPYVCKLGNETTTAAVHILFKSIFEENDKYLYTFAPLQWIWKLNYHRSYPSSTCPSIERNNSGMSKEIGKEGRGEGQVQLKASLNVPEQYQRGFSTLAVDQNTK